MTYYRNRLWVLLANLLYWSDALPAYNASLTGYAVAFDRTTNNYNIPVGAEKAILGIRDLGLICLGQDAVYAINPSTTPVATDKPEKLLDDGCMAEKSAIQVGDDVFYFARDGVRALFRTQLDKVQGGAAYPLSYPLKNEFETINWAQINKACAIYFDNKYFLALPVNSSNYNNQIWIYYPAMSSWMVIDNVNVGAWGKMKISGEERLYYIDGSGGQVYRFWTGTTFEGTAITSSFTGREEDCGYPLQYKNGGELEIETLVAGSGNSLTVNVAVDGGSFQLLGTIDLTSAAAPILPVSLPFTLADNYVMREKFHLDSLGRWRTLQIQIVNTDANTDPIVVYGYSIVTFLEEYESE